MIRNYFTQEPKFERDENGIVLYQRLQSTLSVSEKKQLPTIVEEAKNSLENSTGKVNSDLSIDEGTFSAWLSKVKSS